MASVYITNFGILEETGNYITSIAYGDSGWTFVAGSSGSNSDMNPVIKGFKNGNLLWSSTYGSSRMEETFNHVIFSDGYLYGAGYIQNGFDPAQLNSSWPAYKPDDPTAGGGASFIVKIDPTNGNTILSNIFGSNSPGIDSAEALTIDGSGNVFVAGYTTGDFLGELSGNGAFVAKFAPDLSLTWGRISSGTGNALANSLITDNLGNVYVSGLIYGEINGLEVDGARSDAFIEKYDSNGNLIWTHLYGNGGPIEDYSSGLLVDTEGNIYLASNTSNTSLDQYRDESYYSTNLYKINGSNGGIVWQLNYGSDLLGTDVSSDRNALSFDSSGNVIVSGYTNCGLNGIESLGNFDASIVKISPSGEILSTLILGSSGYEVARQALIDINGNLFIAGDFSSKEYSITETSEYVDIYLISESGFNLNGDSRNNYIRGGAGEDIINGGGGNDVINGGDGLDTADYSFALNAVNIDLSKGNAKGTNAAGITETGTDTLLSVENATGGAGNDLLVGSASANVLYGGDGDDVVSAGQGNDLIIGGDGAGNDTYDGGDGIDTVKYTSAIAGITVNLNLKSANAISTSVDSGIGVDKLTKIENIIAGNYNDIIIGNSSNNSIEGKDGADTINGNNGNDSISGGSGNDALTGGTGNDIFIIDSGTDTITDLGNGQDILQVTSGILNATVTKAWVATNSSYNNAEVNLTSNGQSINLSAVNTGTNGFSLINTGKAATFIGSAFDDSIVGGTGADTLNGRAGFNTLNGGSGNDTYVIDITGATSSNIMFNEVYDSQGVDRLNFTVTSNEFAVIQDSWFSIRRLNDGKDLAIGVFDDNHEEPINGVIIKDQFNYAGGSFNNTINTITLKAPETENKSITFNIAVTGSGSSHLIGTKGVDYIAGFGGNQTLSGGAGNDILSASRFDTAGNTGDTLYGEAGNDDISGKEGNDILDGGVGIDIIEGGDGDDIIYGKEGNDVLTGGDGADTFKFDTALKSNLDRITDFEHLADQIQLSLSIFTNIKGADNVFDSTDLLSGSWTGKQKVNATSSNEHLIFNTANNGLYYDADGSAKGAAVQFATLIGVSSLTLDDFTII
jgi:Ca2+-binding RTX toxin-like protein